MDMTEERCPKCNHLLFVHCGGKFELKLTTEHSVVRKYGVKSKCPNCKIFVSIVKKVTDTE